MIHSSGKDNDWSDFVTGYIDRIYSSNRVFNIFLEKYIAYQPDKDEIYDHASFPGAYCGFNLFRKGVEVTISHKEFIKKEKSTARKIRRGMTENLKRYLEFAEKF